ncbi:MAG: hypothetical protein QXS20_01560 [Candidatus Thorarchaeota archaeon]
MTYEHKNETCTRQTREILEEIISVKAASDEINAVPVAAVFNPFERMMDEEPLIEFGNSKIEETIEESTEGCIRISGGCEDGIGTEQYHALLEGTSSVKTPDDLYTIKRRQNRKL